MRFDTTWITNPSALAAQQKTANAKRLRDLRALLVKVTLVRVWNGNWACILHYDFSENDRGLIVVQRKAQPDAISHAISAFDAREVSDG